MSQYQGSCQCGAVTYDVDVDLGGTITCKCSRCQPMGFVLAFNVNCLAVVDLRALKSQPVDGRSM